VGLCSGIELDRPPVVLDGRIEITIHLMSITLLKEEFRLLETGRILHLLFPLSGPNSVLITVRYHRILKESR
jgi:hypothetical protein